MARPHVELSGGRWHLWRLADEEFKVLGQHALPIVQNYELISALHRRESTVEVHLSLAQALTVLEQKFGPSSPLFDSYRCSFSFPLLITFERVRRISYLLRCHDHRGIVYFPMYRIVPGDPSAAERATCHAPVAEEFSKDEMDDFVRSLYGYLLGYTRLLDVESVAPFYRAVQSDLILYGHDGTSFFEYVCGRWDEFERRRAKLDSQFGCYRPRSPSNRVERLIDRVIGTVGTRGPLERRS